MKRLAILLPLFFNSACVSTRVVLQPQGFEPYRRPDYVDYFDYYFLGFAGRNDVDLQTACMDQRPLAVEQVRGVEDGLITAMTLGIYAPLTVKVWCGD